MDIGQNNNTQHVDGLIRVLRRRDWAYPILMGPVEIGQSPTLISRNGDPGTWEYTLYRDGSPIAGMENVPASVVSSYVYVAADIGPRIQAIQTSGDGAGTNAAASNPVSYRPYIQPGWLECWDASAGVTLVGPDVSVWAGRRTATGILTAPAGLPEFVPTGIGGQPTLRFDGVTDYLYGPLGATLLASGSHTMLLVARRAIAGGFNRLLCLGATTTLRSQIRYNGTGEVATQVAATTTSTSTGGTAFALNDEAVIAGVYDQPATDQVQVWRDGAVLAQAGTATPASDMTHMSIGAQLGGTTPAEIDVAFAGVRAGLLTTQQWSDWMAYCAYRWSI